MAYEPNEADKAAAEAIAGAISSPNVPDWIYHARVLRAEAIISQHMAPERAATAAAVRAERDSLQKQLREADEEVRRLESLLNERPVLP